MGLSFTFPELSTYRYSTPLLLLQLLLTPDALLRSAVQEVENQTRCLIACNISDIFKHFNHFECVMISLTLFPSCPSYSGTPASASAPWAPQSVSAALTRRSQPPLRASPVSPAAPWGPTESTDRRQSGEILTKYIVRRGQHAKYITLISKPAEVSMKKFRPISSNY